MTHAGIQFKLRAFRDLAVANVTWRGRASRKMLFISLGLLYVLGALTVPLGILQLAAPSTGLVAIFLQGLLVCLGLGVGAYLVGAFVRRLHDRGKTSWWLLLFLGPHVTLVLLLTRIPSESTLFNLIFYGGGMIVDFPLLLWWMAETFLLPGTPGRNRFGDDPLVTATSEQSTASA